MLHIAQRFNHSKVLNAISNNHLGQMSVLIKCCQHGNTSNGSAPVISFNIPNNVFYLSKPPAVVPIMPVQGTTPSLVTPIAHTPPQPSVTETLVSTDHVSGPKLPLEEFCRMYHLNDGVQNKFDVDGYSGTHTFPSTEWKDFREAGLEAGEITQLKHAILHGQLHELVDTHGPLYFSYWMIFCWPCLYYCLKFALIITCILKVPRIKEVAFGILRHDNVHDQLDLKQESMKW